MMMEIPLKMPVNIKEEVFELMQKNTESIRRT